MLLSYDQFKESVLACVIKLFEMLSFSDTNNGSNSWQKQIKQPKLFGTKLTIDLSEFGFESSEKHFKLIFILFQTELLNQQI